MIRIPAQHAGTLRSAALVGAVAIATYSNALLNGFVFDDVQNVVENRWIRDLGFLPEIFSNQLAGANSGLTTSYYRPLVHLFNSASYQLFGLDPRGFHLVNVLFHAATSVLVLLLFTSLDPKRPDPRVRLPAPLAGALLFATHPVHTEAVTWVSGLMDVSYTFFFLLSLTLHINARHDARAFGWKRIIAALSFFLALLCKEPALTLPALLLAYDLSAGRAADGPGLRLRHYLPYAAVGCVYLVMRVSALDGLAPSRGFAEIGVPQWLVNVLPLFAQYLGKLAVPVGLSALHPFRPIASLLQPAGAVALVVALALLFAVYRARRAPVALLALSLVVLPLLPALYLPAISGDSVLGERYLYLPSAGFVLLVSLGYSWASRQPRLGSPLLWVAPVALMSLYAFATVTRNTAWKDSRTLWAATVRQVPDSAVAHEHLGHALYSQGDLDQAITHYRRAIDLDPKLADAHINLGVALALKGAGELAADHYRKGLALRPGSAEGHLNLGLALIELGRPGEAAAELQAALASNPSLPAAHNGLGTVFARSGDLDRAIEHFQAASALDPAEPTARGNLAKAIELKRSLDR